MCIQPVVIVSFQMVKVSLIWQEKYPEILIGITLVSGDFNGETGDKGHELAKRCSNEEETQLIYCRCDFKLIFKS